MIQHPCFYGIDTPTKEELINAMKTKDEVKDYIEANSLEYLTIDNLKEALGRDRNYSLVSFDGDYFVV
jgi:amidophosphoribosyltransferase